MQLIQTHFSYTSSHFFTTPTRALLWTQLGVHSPPLLHIQSCIQNVFREWKGLRPFIITFPNPLGQLLLLIHSLNPIKLIFVCMW